MQKNQDILDLLTANINSSKELIGSLLDYSTDCILLSDKKGVILYCNNSVINLLGRNPKNIKDYGYLFSTDLCILDNDISILEYSPINLLLENDYDTTVDLKYEGMQNTEKLFTATSKFIADNHYLIILSERSNENINQSYADLVETNKNLLDKIKENEELRTQAQSQVIRESLVNSISNAIRNSLEIDIILQTAVEEIGKTLGTDRTFLIKTISDKTEFFIAHEYVLGSGKKTTGSIVKSEEDLFIQQVIETKEPTTASHTDPEEKETNVDKFKLIIPIIHHEELFGMLILIRKNRRWHPEEMNLVQAIADQISVAIKNAQLYEDTTSKNIKISVLNEILKSINSSLILDDVFYTIGREIKRLINFDRASIAILDDNTKQIKLFARISKTGSVDILKTGPLLAKGTAISWAIENLKPILISMKNQKEFSDTLTLKRSGIQSALIIPMINKGNVTGIFYVGSSAENVYTESELEIMEQIAGQLAVAVENAKLYWQTQIQAMKETLINQIVSSIRKSLSLSDVIKATVKELSLALAVDYCFFKHYLDNENNNKVYDYSSRQTNNITSSILELTNHSTIKEVLNKNELVNYKITDKDLANNIKAFMSTNNVQSLLMLNLKFYEPIQNEDILLGIMGFCQFKHEKDWSVEDISLLKVLAEQIIITVNQAQLFEKTQQQKLQLENAFLKLKETQAQLVQSEKMAALGQLVAGVAHEINTPIGSITSNNAVFKKCNEKLQKLITDTPDNTEKIQQLLELMKDTIGINYIACDRINDIVKSLKNFARLDESELKKVNIHEGINSTLTLIMHEIKGRVEIIKEFSDLPDIECYPNLLNQVFMNLLVNAYQSIKDKGSITITTQKDEDNIYISVTDTGSGISSNNLKKIFDPGFTTKGVGVGTGLGLSISYQIIEKHKGQIIVESKLGKGSTFTVIVPIKQS